jgi:hypothetical protein
MKLFLSSPRKLLYLFLAFCTLSLSGFVWAHHSFAMFDSANQIRMTGVVTQFDWTNPHIYIEMDVTDAAGATKHWTIECAPSRLEVQHHESGRRDHDHRRAAAQRSARRAAETGDAGRWQQVG